MDDKSWIERNFPELDRDDTGRPARALATDAYMHLHGQGQPDAPRPIP